MSNSTTAARLQPYESCRQERALTRPGDPHPQRASVCHEVPVVKTIPGIGPIRTPFIFPHTEIAIPGFDGESI